MKVIGIKFLKKIIYLINKISLLVTAKSFFVITEGLTKLVRGIRIPKSGSRQVIIAQPFVFSCFQISAPQHLIKL